MNREQYKQVQNKAHKAASEYANDMTFEQELQRLASKKLLAQYENAQETLYILFEKYSLYVENCLSDLHTANMYFIQLETLVGGPDKAGIGVYGQLNDLFQKAAKEIYPKRMKAFANYFLALIKGSTEYLPKLSDAQLMELPLPSRKYADLNNIQDTLVKIPTKVDSENKLWVDNNPS